MKNKVLIKLIVIELGQEFDVFIPVNEVMWKIKKLIVKSISDLVNIPMYKKECVLMNKENNRIYQNNEIVIQTDIRNGSEIVLIFK